METFDLIHPTELRYRLLKILKGEFKNDYTAGYIAQYISEKYEKDYNRCKDICQMLREDEQ